MAIAGVTTQLRTTDLAASVRFYTTKVGLALDFQYEDFYAGIRAGDQLFHLKLVDEKDPSIAFVEKGDHFHLYLETDDADATAAACTRRRGEPGSSPSRTIKATRCTSASLARGPAQRRAVPTSSRIARAAAAGSGAAVIGRPTTR
jgi:predicted enzyme related to lactoylglutathione lyase